MHLCWLRVCLSGALLLLHVTQGSKWHDLSALERSHPVMIAVRPLPLVNDTFISLSVYLCVRSHQRADKQTPCASNGYGATPDPFSGSTLTRRIVRCCLRTAHKYVRQVPLTVLWAWVYTRILPYVSYNPYNHTYPWFGLRWFHKTAACMGNRGRYAFLMGDLGHFFFRDGGEDWSASNGNPCANLCNFQLEIEVFAVVSFLLALPSTMGSAIIVIIAAASMGAIPHGTGRGKDIWWVYHARGVAIMLLSLRALGLPRTRAPWRSGTALRSGLVLVLAAFVVHGVADGEWLHGSSISQWLEDMTGVTLFGGRPAWITVVYQGLLAVGMGLLCEGCRTTLRVIPSAMPNAASTACRGDGDGARSLATVSRLSFGVNAAHPFIQFWIEAHASPDIRVFTVFGWLTSLSGITCLSALAAACAYVFVQRPWAIFLGSCLEGAVRALSPLQRCSTAENPVESGDARS